MKRFFLSLTVILVTCLNCMAGGVKVKEGKSAFLKEKVNAIIEFDFSKTTWEEEENFKTWCGDQYEKRINAIQKSFWESFNDNSKGLKLIESENEAKYKVIIEVIDLERHQAFTGSWGQGKFSTTASIKVFEISSNELICEIYADGFGSGKDYDYADGLGKCYKGLAKTITKLK